MVIASELTNLIVKFDGVADVVTLEVETVPTVS